MTAQSRDAYGPSWADVTALQGDIQGSYGGFCFVQMFPAKNVYGRPKTFWVVKWGPDIIHAALAHYRAVTDYYPHQYFRTVPGLLEHMLQQLDKSLRADEEHRARLRMPRLSAMVLPPIRVSSLDYEQLY